MFGLGGRCDGAEAGLEDEATSDVGKTIVRIPSCWVPLGWGPLWSPSSGPHLQNTPQDVDEAYMNKVELESRLEGLTDEINFYRQLYEEVCSCCPDLIRDFSRPQVYHRQGPTSE